MTPPTKQAVIESDLRMTPLWEEWMQCRKSKGYRNTQRSITMLVRELNKIQDYGISVETAITEALDHDWAGIKLEWLDDYKPNGKDKVPSYKDEKGLLRYAQEHGIKISGCNWYELEQRCRNESIGGIEKCKLTSHSR